MKVTKLKTKKKKEWKISVKSKDMSLSSIKLKTSNYNDARTKEVINYLFIYYQKDKRLPCETMAKTLPANARDTGSILTLGRFHFLWVS